MFGFNMIIICVKEGVSMFIYYYVDFIYFFSNFFVYINIRVVYSNYFIDVLFFQFLYSIFE